ncbi:MAG TPA: polysaccharide deacetylase family protein [Streptosporangiaceae bacterium]|nr:polysaccharide deacetylase family protein [Streptosporangiaceae bacterium]
MLNYEEGSERTFSDDGRNEGLGELQRTVGADFRDLATESVYEYGSRAGIYRLLRLLDEYQVPATLFAAAVALERNPPLCAVLRQSDHEICGHGLRWSEDWTVDRSVERERIADAVRSIEATCGQRPVGWYNRWMPSRHTRELLVEVGGFRYDSNAYNDDLPYWTSVNGVGHLVVPYTLTYNDVRYVTAGIDSPAAFVESCKRGMRYLLREGAEGSPKMMSIGLHARWSGQASRASAVRELLDYAVELGSVWIACRSEIADTWRDQHPFDASTG